MMSNKQSRSGDNKMLICEACGNADNQKLTIAFTHVICQSCIEDFVIGAHEQHKGVFEDVGCAVSGCTNKGIVLFNRVYYCATHWAFRLEE